MKIFEDKLQTIQNSQENILSTFKNGQELLDELKEIAYQAYQTFNAKKGEKELNDGLMEDVEDKCEQYSGSTDDEG